jgi:preprotein translocase subunit YajC
MMLLFILLPFLLLMLMNRSQTKKQKQIEASLKVGDRVITQSGLVGKLVDVGERQVKLEIAPGVNVQMLKGAITGPEGGDQKAAEAKAKEPSKEPSKDKPQEKKA